MEWISINHGLPEYDPVNQKAFDILISASNDRYYTGYCVIEYGKPTFYQHNGRKILKVTHWMYIPINNKG